MGFARNENRVNWVAVKTAKGWWKGFNHFTDDVAKARLFGPDDKAAEFYRRNERRYRTFAEPIPVEFEIVKVRRDIKNFKYVFSIKSA